jgi:hypothetical protein
MKTRQVYTTCNIFSLCVCVCVCEVFNQLVNFYDVIKRSRFELRGGWRGIVARPFYKLFY